MPEARILQASSSMKLPLALAVHQPWTVDCVRECRSRWFCGDYGFVCENPVPLPFIACRGHRMFYTYTPAAEALAAEQADL